VIASRISAIRSSVVVVVDDEQLANPRRDGPVGDRSRADAVVWREA
jgi:hypothetical protein